MKANLNNASLRGANLSGANLSEANLSETNLSNANLSNANLCMSILARTNLTNTNFHNVILGNTSFGDVNIRDSEGLETAIHLFPSHIDMATILKSEGQVPDIFLKRAGIPDDVTQYLLSKAKVKNPNKYYSCFILYSGTEEEFAEKLFQNLKSENIWCWKWNEYEVGRQLYNAKDANWFYDKLIAICSVNSLQSGNFVSEIERGLQKENEIYQEGKTSELLCLIRIDDYIFNDWSHYMKSDFLKKSVGDFKKWKDPYLYTAAYDRLLKKLKEA
jgi:hypothetical protein